MESHTEVVGDILDDIHLLFEVNSFVTMTDSCTSSYQGTLYLPGDDFLSDASALFLESHTVDLEDFLDDLSLLFAEDNPSTVVARAYFDPHVHSLHDQSLQVSVIVDTSVQHLQEISLSFEKTVGFLKQVPHHSLFDLHFFSAALEEAIISIDIGS